MDYKARITEEASELHNKMEKIVKFKQTVEYTQLSVTDQYLLTSQYNIMGAYLEVLKARLMR